MTFLRHYPSLEGSGSNQTAKLITLQFAYTCLRNALKLIPSNIEIALQTKARKSSTSHFLTKSSSNLDDVLETADALLDLETENSGLNSDEQVSEAIQAASMDGSSSELAPKSRPYFFDCVWPSKPIGLRELQTLRSSILVSLSYVSLCLKDYASTIRHCKLLLSEADFLNAKFPVSNGNKWDFLFVFCQKHKKVFVLNCSDAKFWTVWRSKPPGQMKCFCII